MSRFRIWSLWTDRSEDTGLVVLANSTDAAVCKVFAMGIGFGLGSRPRYLGLAAVPS